MKTAGGQRLIKRWGCHECIINVQISAFILMLLIVGKMHTRAIQLTAVTELKTVKRVILSTKTSKQNSRQGGVGFNLLPPNHNNLSTEIITGILRIMPLLLKRLLH